MDLSTIGQKREMARAPAMANEELKKVGERIEIKKTWRIGHDTEIGATKRDSTCTKGATILVGPRLLGQKRGRDRCDGKHSWCPFMKTGRGKGRLGSQRKW